MGTSTRSTSRAILNRVPSPPRTTIKSALLAISFLSQGLPPDALKPASTSGHIFPRKMFQEKGIYPTRDFKKVIYSGGHDATVLAVLNRKVDAGATFANFSDGREGAWTRYLKDPQEQKKIRAIAFSDPIPADNIVVSANMDPVLSNKIKKIFLDLSADPAGKKMLRDLYRIDGFVPASDEDYDSVRRAFKIAGINLKKALKK